MAREHPTSFLLGLILGGVIGTVLGILYAPQSGEKTRKLIAKKFEETKKRALEVKKETEAKVGEIARRAKKAAREFKKETKTTK